MKHKPCTRTIMQNASERGACCKLSLWSSSSVVHPFEYGAYCILFPLHEGQRKRCTIPFFKGIK